MTELYPIKTYSEDLDKIIGGFYPGGRGLLYLRDLWTSSEFDRIITSAIGIPYWERRRFMIEESNVELNDFIAKQVYDLPLIFRYAPNLMAHELFDDIWKLYKYKDVKIIYMDGVHASCPGDSCFFQKLKQLAQEMNIPIVVAYYCRGIDVINNEKLLIFLTVLLSLINIGVIELSVSCKCHFM